MGARLTAALVLSGSGLLLGGGASATPPVVAASPATAQGFAVEIVAPDQTTIAATPETTAPPDAAPVSQQFLYPADGSIVSTDATYASSSASTSDGSAAVVSEVTNLSLFGGEITVADVRGSVSSAGTTGDLADSTLTGLVVLGQPVPQIAPNTKLSLGDWGEAVLLGETTEPGTASAPGWRGSVTALDVQLNADHDGLAAGTEIRIGVADAFAPPPPAPTTTTEGKTTAQAPSRPQATRPAKRPNGSAGARKAAKSRAKARKKRKRHGPPVITPPTVTPKLTKNRYVFPVYGPSGYGDTFGAPRGDVSGGWHHGDDIFAPLGAPVLAVADGTVFSVGWNEIGGWRLWLRDSGGNEFYYAHLSAYTTLAVNGTHVKAGQVLGFVGNTGDAQGTPYHLHFEVHPVSLLFLGYDGAVDPTKYLDAWKRLQDVRILPAVPFAPPAASGSAAPAPGAILLESTDISTANGLDPASLARAMNALPTVDVSGGGISKLPVPLPVLDRA